MRVKLGLLAAIMMIGAAGNMFAACPWGDNESAGSTEDGTITWIGCTPSG